jgi:hypothetical protein
MTNMKLRTLVTVGAAVVLAMGLAGCTTSSTNAVSSCPKTAVTPAKTHLAGAATSLVPLRPTKVLLCKYRAPEFNKPVESLALSGFSARAMAREFNAAVVPGYSTGGRCPNLMGASVVAYFSNTQNRIVVRVHSDGCQTANNGTQTQAWVANVSLGSHLAKLIHS